MQAGDDRSGFFGFVQDLGDLVITKTGPAYLWRMRNLRRVANGEVTVDPESRLGAFVATLGYERGTVGYAVNRAIGFIYLELGTYGEERIGTVFNSPEAKFHYPNPVDGNSSYMIAQMEHEYWKRVRSEDTFSGGGQLGSIFVPTVRDWLQRNPFTADFNPF